MSQLSKQALKVENNTSFPNNNTNYITPSILRDYNTNVIDSFVDENKYNVDSGSWNAEIAALSASISQSLSPINTGSFLLTASANLNTITFTKADASQFTITVDTGSGTATDLTALNAFTQSQDSKNLTLASYTASVDNSINLLNASTASQEVSINALNSFTASQDSKNSTLASYTSSNDTKWNTLGGQSGSWITESETGSFARYDISNPWSADQTFTNITATSASFQYVKTVFETASVIYSSGSNQFGDAADDVQTLYGSTRIVNELTASGLNYPTADNGEKSFIQTDGNGNLSLQYVDTIFETFYAGESVPKGTPLYFSGSQGANPIARAADASNPNKMPVIVIANENLTAGTVYEGIVLGLIEGLNLTGFTAGQTVYVAEGGGYSTQLPSGSNSITQVLGIVTKGGNGGKGLVLNPGPAQLPGLIEGYAWVGNASNQPVAVATSSFATVTDLSSLNAFTESADSRLNNLEAATASYVTEAITGSSLVTASVSLSTITFTKGDGNTFNITVDTGSATDISELNAFTASQLLINGDYDLFTASADSRLGNIEGLTGSLLLTASVSLNTITFTKVDSSTFDITVDTGSAASIDTGSFITTGSATTASQEILGDFSFNTEYITNNPYTSQVGGGTTIEVSYGDIFNATQLGYDFIYWLDTNFNGVTVAGPGITNGAITGYNYGAGVEVFITTGTITNGGTYIFTGPAFQAVDITGSLNISQILRASGVNGTSELKQAAITAFNSVLFAGIGPGLVSAQADSSAEQINFTISSSAYNGTATWPGAQISSVYNGNEQSLIGFQTQKTWTDGTVAFLTPISASAGVTASDAYLNGELYSVTSASFDSRINNIVVGTGFATTGSNAFDGAQEITGALNVTGQILTEANIVSQQSIDAYGPLYANNSADVYGNLNVFGSQTITGSLVVTGSVAGNVVALTITSDTASMDLAAGNYFTLTLPSSSNTFIEATNIKPGLDAKLLITAGVSSSVVFANNILQPANSMYTASAESQMDLVSLITFDDTNVYATVTKDFTMYVPPTTTTTSTTSTTTTTTAAPPTLQPLATSASLWAYYDIAYTASYNGTGSTVYDLSGEGHNGSIVGTVNYNDGGVLGNVLRLGASGQGNRVEMPSLGAPANQTWVIAWLGKNISYQFATTELFMGRDDDAYGIYAGNADLGWRAYPAINAADQYPDYSNPVSSSIPDVWHISQFSFNDSTNNVNYCFDGSTGSFTLVTSVDGGITPKWNYNSSFTSRYMGSGSMMQVMAIYTGSLTTNELLANHNSIKDRYGL
jgi:hypothetical protein